MVLSREFWIIRFSKMNVIYKILFKKVSRIKYEMNQRMNEALK